MVILNRLYLRNPVVFEKKNLVILYSGKWIRERVRESFRKKKLFGNHKIRSAFGYSREYVHVGLFFTSPFSRFQKNKHKGTKISPFVCNFSNLNHKNELKFNELKSFLRSEFNFNCRISSNKLIFILHSIMFGFIPAFIIDFFLMFFGEKCRFVVVYYPIYMLYLHSYTWTWYVGILNSVNEYLSMWFFIFVVRIFQAYRSMVKFNSDVATINFSPRVNKSNVENCWKNLNDIDRKLFSFDLNEVVWDEYLPMSAGFLREYFHTFIEKHRKMRLAVFW